MGLTTPLTAPIQALAGYGASFAWPGFLSLSRATILSLLQRITTGQLKITDVDGTITVCGQDKLKPIPQSQRTVYSVPVTELVVNKDVFWARLLLFADMGFAESYMLGEVSCPDLTSFFQLFIVNRESLSNGSTATSLLANKLAGFLRRTNTLHTARLNIAAHYDISNAMFEAFLSKDMTYSCPVWSPKSDPRSATETHEEAQERKLMRFVENAKIKSTDHVLEIGTGWGSFAITAVRKTGCRVTSLTLSQEQKVLAEERIAEAGFTDNIEVLLCDYRALPIPKDTGKYDKVVSIEMLEAVGKEFLSTYFECIDKLLKKDGGIAVFQCITMPENRYDAYSKSDDFIRRYIFPGGHLPTVTQLLNAAKEGSNATLIPDGVENIGPHYAKTLRLWKEKFFENFDSDIKPALLREHRGMSENDVQLFKRKWEYYFTYCEAGFLQKSLGDVIITFAREGALEVMEDVPL
ncbi:Mycolic acid cyclopropane synthetase-domain-containing protein [Elsinoe ampelina]|uniref:Mycolic acid cyclopropane synthetase-domain-containing protein n=1 Tax=Elsinoe ampelina TaxID=302913 RepID=A0A6A6GMD1_9PEZI|nr:Mycolic acid cyclopropane synthetase-domain-containing protein [Elsinoe ampelina]